MGLVNESVPLAKLRERTRALAKELLGKNPTVLRAASRPCRRVQGMAWETSDDYLMAKGDAGAPVRSRRTAAPRG